MCILLPFDFESKIRISVDDRRPCQHGEPGKARGVWDPRDWRTGTTKSLSWRTNNVAMPFGSKHTYTTAVFSATRQTTPGRRWAWSRKPQTVYVEQRELINLRGVTGPQWSRANVWRRDHSISGSGFGSRWSLRDVDKKNISGSETHLSHPLYFFLVRWNFCTYFGDSVFSRIYAFLMSSWVKGEMEVTDECERNLIESGEERNENTTYVLTITIKRFSTWDFLKVDHF